MAIKQKSSPFRIENRTWENNAVVATEPINAHTVIYQSREFLILPYPNYQTVQIAENAHILDHVFANLNHHCSPNTFIDVSNFSLVAERNIAPGEQLTFAYFSTEVALDRPFSCQCDSLHCVGKILGASQMSAQNLLRYSLSQHVLELSNMEGARFQP